MSKKKRFVISQSLQQGLSETFNAVKNNAGNVRFEVVSVSRVETDPENPRELKITPEDIRKGLDKNDEFFIEKQQEISKINTLAGTIQKKGLINPIVVYKHGDIYRLVAGERRFLASILASKEDIQARILNEKPKDLDLRLLQWIENTEREDLSLKDRIGNIRMILTEYLNEYPGKEISATLIKELIGISLSQASCYMAVLHAPHDVEKQILQGNINNLDKAALIAKIDEKGLRQKMIESCIKGDSLKVLKQMTLSRQKERELPPILPLRKKPGRASSKVNLGATRKPTVIRKIISIVVNDPALNHIEPHFNDINWSEFSEVSKAFRKFLILLEKEVF